MRCDRRLRTGRLWSRICVTTGRPSFIAARRGSGTTTLPRHGARAGSGGYKDGMILDRTAAAIDVLVVNDVVQFAADQFLRIGEAHRSQECGCRSSGSIALEGLRVRSSRMRLPRR